MNESDLNKSDLKTGYLVELRDGRKGVIANVLNSKGVPEMRVCFFESGAFELNNYTDDLVYNVVGHNYTDIIKVWEFSTSDRDSAHNVFEIKNKELLWKEMKNYRQ